MNTLLLDLRVFVSFEEPIVVVEVMIVNVAESQFGFVPQLSTGFRTRKRQSDRW